MSTDTEKLLRASILILRQQERIKALETEREILEARLRVSQLHLERYYRDAGERPALLRPQI